MDKEKFYNKYDRAYHWDRCSRDLFRMDAYLIARYEIIMRLVKKYSGISCGKVLDAGCGDGMLTSLIAGEGYSVDGVDTNLQGIEIARSKFEQKNILGDFYVIDSYRYPFEEEVYDIVVCSDVIEHVKEPVKMLNEIKRVLKKGGYLIISTPVKIPYRPLSPNHVQEWTAQEFRSFCSEVFGIPVEGVLSHPLVFYNAYTSKNRVIRKISRSLINSFTLAGLNLFLARSNGDKSGFEMQFLVLQKT